MRLFLTLLKLQSLRKYLRRVVIFFKFLFLIDIYFAPYLSLPNFCNIFEGIFLKNWTVLF